MYNIFNILICISIRIWREPVWLIFESGEGSWHCRRNRLDKFFALRVAPPAHPAPVEAVKKKSFNKYQSYRAHGTQIVTRNHQNGAQKPPKWRPQPLQNRAQIGPRGGQDDQKIEK